MFGRTATRVSRASGRTAPALLKYSRNSVSVQAVTSSSSGGATSCARGSVAASEAGVFGAPVVKACAFPKREDDVQMGCPGMECPRCLQVLWRRAPALEPTPGRCA